MRILVVDDDAARQVSFKRQLGGHHLTSVLSGDEAVRIVQNDTFDVMFLDHDLGLGPDGRDVARAVVSTSLIRNVRPLLVVVHSWNPGGARAMTAILGGHVRKLCKSPFSDDGMAHLLGPLCGEHWVAAVAE